MRSYLALNNENRMYWALSLSLFQDAVGPNRLHSRPQQYIGADKQVQTCFVSVRNHNQYRRVVSLRHRVDGDDTLHSTTRLRLHWALNSPLSGDFFFYSLKAQIYCSVSLVGAEITGYRSRVILDDFALCHYSGVGP